MGLDMYAFAVPAEAVGNQQTDPDLTKEGGQEEWEREQFFYWRKHPDLHGWMQDLYERKGGTDPTFNCNKVRLDLDDLDELERDLTSLPKTEGFFFGTSTPDDTEHDKAFIAKAREKIAEGKAVFYDSWW